MEHEKQLIPEECKRRVKKKKKCDENLIPRDNWIVPGCWNLRKQVYGILGQSNIELVFALD